MNDSSWWEPDSDSVTPTPSGIPERPPQPPPFQSPPRFNTQSPPVFEASTLSDQGSSASRLDSGNLGSVNTEENPKRAQKILRLTAAGGLVTLILIAVLSGAWVAYGFISSGGAGSPEEAVTTLFEGIARQDPLVSASVLNPDELPLLTDLIGELGDARGRVSVGENGVDLPGTKIEVNRLKLKSKELSPDVTRVTIRSGEIKAQAKVRDMPDVVQNAMTQVDEKTGKFKYSVNDFEDNFGMELTAIVIKKGRGWYVSPSLTAADLFVENSNWDLEEGDFDSFGETNDFEKGAESAEEALEATAAAVSGGDPAEIAAVLPSGQGQLAVVYKEAFDQFFEKVFADEGFESPALAENWFKLRSVDTVKQDGPDGTVRLLIDSAKFQVADPKWGEDPRDGRIRGLKVCSSLRQEAADCDNLIYRFLGNEKSYVGRRIDKALDSSLSVIVREVDGGWKVDPVATVMDMGIRILKQIDKEIVDSAILNTNGDATRIELATVTDISFSSGGLARIVVPTEKGTLYRLDIAPGKSDYDDFGELDARISTGNGGEVNAGDTIFRAEGTETTIAIGGIFHEFKQSQVRVDKAASSEQAFESEIKGTMSSSIEIHEVPLTAARTDQDGDRLIVVDGSASKPLELMTLGRVDDIKGAWDGWAESLTLEKAGSDDYYGPLITAIDSDRVFVVLQGEVGTSYSYTVSTEKQGFEDGSTSKVVTVQSGSITRVPISIGSTYSDLRVSITWSDGADIDASLTIDGSVADSSTSSYDNGSIYLDGSGSGDASVSLKTYGMGSTSVTVGLDFYSN